LVRVNLPGDDGRRRRGGDLRRARRKVTLLTV
jgi:hypothetical protein